MSEDQKEQMQRGYTNYTCTEVKLTEVLHLKTGVNYLENNNLLVSGEFIGKAEFDQYNRYEVPEKEAYAANCIWVNGTVIVPDGYSAVLDAVKSMGYETITVDTSEFRKLDGGPESGLAGRCRILPKCLKQPCFPYFAIQPDT